MRNVPYNLTGGGNRNGMVMSQPITVHSTVHQVFDYMSKLVLNGHRFSDVAANFRAECIDGKILLNLEKSELSKLGIFRLNRRNAFFQHIVAMRCRDINFGYATPVSRNQPRGIPPMPMSANPRYSPSFQHQIPQSTSDPSSPHPMNLANRPMNAFGHQPPSGPTIPMSVPNTMPVPNPMNRMQMNPQQYTMQPPMAMQSVQSARSSGGIPVTLRSISQVQMNPMAQMLPSPIQMAQQQMSPQEIAARQMLLQQIATQQMAPQQMTSQQMAPQQMAPQQMAPQQMAPQQMAPQQMTAQQMTAQQMMSPLIPPQQNMMVPNQMISPTQIPNQMLIQNPIQNAIPNQIPNQMALHHLSPMRPLAAGPIALQNLPLRPNRFSFGSLTSLDSNPNRTKVGQINQNARALKKISRDTRLSVASKIIMDTLAESNGGLSYVPHSTVAQDNEPTSNPNTSVSITGTFPGSIPDLGSITLSQLMGQSRTSALSITPSDFTTLTSNTFQDPRNRLSQQLAIATSNGTASRNTTSGAAVPWPITVTNTLNTVDVVPIPTEPCYHQLTQTNKTQIKFIGVFRGVNQHNQMYILMTKQDTRAFNQLSNKWHERTRNEHPTKWKLMKKQKHRKRCSMTNIEQIFQSALDIHKTRRGWDLYGAIIPFNVICTYTFDFEETRIVSMAAMYLDAVVNNVVTVKKRQQNHYMIWITTPLKVDALEKRRNKAPKGKKCGEIDHLVFSDNRNNQFPARDSSYLVHDFKLGNMAMARCQRGDKVRCCMKLSTRTNQKIANSRRPVFAQIWNVHLATPKSAKSAKKSNELSEANLSRSSPAVSDEKEKFEEERKDASTRSRSGTAGPNGVVSS